MVSSVAEINPTHNIQIRNIWHMLVYAWDILPLGQNKQASSEPSPDLLGLMARVLANSTQKLVLFPFPVQIVTNKKYTICNKLAL